MAEHMIPSIAARKAARKKSLYAPESTPQSAEAPAATYSSSSTEEINHMRDQINGLGTADAVVPAPLTTTPFPTMAAETSPGSLSVSSYDNAIHAPAASESVPAKISAQDSARVEVQRVQPNAQESQAIISKEMLLRLAKQHGLDLAPQRREFTKHTYSITPSHKETMKKYTEVLGVAMQDAVCEAFDLFFEKHREEFEAIRKAKGQP